MATFTPPNMTQFGHVLTTQGANATFSVKYLMSCWIRHTNNDWGDLDPEDARLNREAVSRLNGSRVMSVYKDERGKTLWIITSGLGNDPSDPDMCNTVLLLPEEY